MDVDFADESLRQLAGDSAAADTRYSIAVIRSYQNKVQLIRNAPDERTLRNWKSLHYEKLKGGRKHQRSIRLNNQWRLIIELEDTTSPKTVMVIGIEDYHK